MALDDDGRDDEGPLVRVVMSTKVSDEAADVVLPDEETERDL